MTHPHSLAAYRDSIADLSARERQIYHYILGVGPQTARQIKSALYPGRDMNMIRPRLVELKAKGLIEESGQAIEGGRMVAIFRVVQNGQGGLW